MGTEQSFSSSNTTSIQVDGNGTIIENISMAQFNTVNMDLGAQVLAQDELMPEIVTAVQEDFVLDETLQQQILMDLFWPGWPPNLPEPNIVNDL